MWYICQNESSGYCHDVCPSIHLVHVSIWDGHALCILITSNCEDSFNVHCPFISYSIFCAFEARRSYDVKMTSWIMLAIYNQTFCVVLFLSSKCWEQMQTESNNLSFGSYGTFLRLCHHYGLLTLHMATWCYTLPSILTLCAESCGIMRCRIVWVQCIIRA